LNVNFDTSFIFYLKCEHFADGFSEFVFRTSFKQYYFSVILCFSNVLFLSWKKIKKARKRE